MNTTETFNLKAKKRTSTTIKLEFDETALNQNKNNVSFLDSLDWFAEPIQ